MMSGPEWDALVEAWRSHNECMYARWIAGLIALSTVASVSITFSLINYWS